MSRQLTRLKTSNVIRLSSNRLILVPDMRQLAQCAGQDPLPALIGVKARPDPFSITRPTQEDEAMSYKTILVSLNEVGRLPQLLAAAAKLARETLGTHVSGLYVIPAVQVYPSVGFEAAPQVFEGNRSFFKDNAAKVREAASRTR